MFTATSTEAQDKIITDFWENTFLFDRMVTNKFTKEGKEMATCPYGRTVEASGDTDHCTENGVTLYVCSDAYATGIHRFSPEMRMQKQMAYLHMAPSTDTKEQMVTCEWPQYLKICDLALG